MEIIKWSATSCMQENRLQPLVISLACLRSNNFYRLVLISECSLKVDVNIFIEILTRAGQLCHLSRRKYKLVEKRLFSRIVWDFELFERFLGFTHELLELLRWKHKLLKFQHTVWSNLFPVLKQSDFKGFLRFLGSFWQFLITSGWCWFPKISTLHTVLISSYELWLLYELW